MINDLNGQNKKKKRGEHRVVWGGLVTYPEGERPPDGNALLPPVFGRSNDATNAQEGPSVATVGKDGFN